MGEYKRSVLEQPVLELNTDPEYIRRELEESAKTIEERVEFLRSCRKATREQLLQEVYVLPR